MKQRLVILQGECIKNVSSCLHDFLHLVIGIFCDEDFNSAVTFRQTDINIDLYNNQIAIPEGGDSPMKMTGVLFVPFNFSFM